MSYAIGLDGVSQGTLRILNLPNATAISLDGFTSRRIGPLTAGAHNFQLLASATNLGSNEACAFDILVENVGT
jgi:hypothetical protein